jgi:hypothetical protein
MRDRPAPCTTVRHTSWQTKSESDAHVRLMNIKKTRAGPPRRLASYLRRLRGDPVAGVPIDQLGSFCFGTVGERDRLALKGLVDGQEPSHRGRSLQRHNRDRTDPTP